MPLFGRRRYLGLVGPKDDGKGGGFATKVINFGGAVVLGAATAGAGTAVLAAAGAATCSVGAAAATGAVTSAAASIAKKEPAIQAGATGGFGGGAGRSSVVATDGKHEVGGADQDRADASAPKQHAKQHASPKLAAVKAPEMRPAKLQLENAEPTLAEIEAAFAKNPPKPHQLCHALPQLRERVARERRKAEVATFARDELWGPTFEQDAQGMLMGPPERGELVIDPLLGMAGTVFLTHRAARATKEADSVQWWVRKLETEGNCGPELMKE